jgi:hypothetical protein
MGPASGEEVAVLLASTTDDPAASDIGLLFPSLASDETLT